MKENLNFLTKEELHLAFKKYARCAFDFLGICRSKV